ncbi:ArsA family ATPase [Synechococcus sp. PCC 7336]|uniref:Get3/ArsA fold putative tail anchor-mediating ATPase NosAFP n=1 Tax=Synechococcus sp. PCC 7336 TaxID=195250 RepID=UPI00034B390A|nr:ArsA family ATPase [Synechococcus sp. PCC 7336]
MSQILTFLGKGGTGKTIAAIAAAKASAQQGQRTLLVGQQEGLALELLLGMPIASEPTAIADNLWAMQFRGTQMVKDGWAMVKELEAQYIRTPFFKEIYAQEIPILPGMEAGLLLSALRSFDASGDYDVLIYDGAGDLATLRTFGIPEVGGWYQRRTSKAFLESDLYKTLKPFVDPLLQAVMPGSPSSDQLAAEWRERGSDLLGEGKQAIADPGRVRAYVVTTQDKAAIATARFLWGSAQMVGLTVGGALIAPHGNANTAELQFAPLPAIELPLFQPGQWSAIVEAIAPVLQTPDVPPPLAIDIGARTVRLFIPGFSREQIGLSQSGPELTVTAGDQRRNLFLPDGLAGRQVTGAKFEEPFLTVRLA